MAMHLWPERVIPKCSADRSLAIVHNLDSFFWEENDGAWRPIKRKKEEVDAVIATRTSAAVKAALKDLLDATAPVPGNRKRKATIK
jgi:hypothetical protein